MNLENEINELLKDLSSCIKNIYLLVLRTLPVVFIICVMCILFISDMIDGSCMSVSEIHFYSNSITMVWFTFHI
jgi:hypothetical protein